METEGQRDFFRLIAGFVMPPVGVGMQEGFTGVFYLNILFTLMCWFPGVIHAAWIITRRDSDGRIVEGGTGRFVALLLSYFLPPVGVFLTRGVSVRLLVNILLTLLGYLPGILHAVWEVATDADEAA